MRHKTKIGVRTVGLAGATAAAVLAAGWATASPAFAAKSPTAGVAAGILTVTGGNGADRIALRLRAGTTGVLEVDFGDDGSAEFSFDRSTFGAIEVFTLNGADQFRVDQANGAFADETLTVDGGRGDDVLNGGDGAERFLGQNGDDSVDGNRGNDTGILGSGDDSFRWDPGDGSDVVEGERGFDTLDFNGAGVDEIMSLSADGERSVFLRNVANIRMDMNRVERLDLTTLGGIDTFTLNDMSGTDFRAAQVDLSGPAGGPDGAADVVTVNGTARADSIQVGVPGVTDVDVPVVGLQTELLILGSEVADVLQIKTLGGNDTVSVDDDIPSIITPVVDLGADQV